MTDKQPRDVRGRFTKIDVERDVLAPGLGVPREYADGLRPRYAPAGDVLAQGGESSPPGVRTAQMTGVQRDAGSEVYTTPRTGESGRLGPQQARYILGDVGESAPGEVAATARYGIQGRWGREAARRSTDPMSPVKHLTGAGDD